MISLDEYLSRIKSLEADEIYMVVEKDGVATYLFYARVDGRYYRLGDKDLFEPIYVNTPEKFKKYVEDLGIFYNGHECVKIK